MKLKDIGVIDIDYKKISIIIKSKEGYDLWKHRYESIHAMLSAFEQINKKWTEHLSQKNKS